MGTTLPEFQAAADAIERDGWYVCDGLLDMALVRALAAECLRMDALSRLKPAAIGRRGRRRLATAVRGDRTHWLDESFSDVQAAFLGRMLALRDALNQRLLLGLRTFEAHYAIYPAGAHYDRHRDRFRDDDARVLSAVVYLNEDWTASDGGALRMYLPSGGQRDVLPQAGRVALFLSDDFEHEVLPPARPRMSVAGWFRRREHPF